ncbi:MAG: glycoside hydrolase N-terminal domain-containing protein [Phycisphaerae bacterium]|nr:glycoside hydrolase N-terminal domain-containing protein [Phycisphaerae bacterium]
MTPGRHCIWSASPTTEWNEGYPIGNGRLGAMILGDPLAERVALNHDRLWRRFWNYQPPDTLKDLPELRRLYRQGRWDEALELLHRTIPVSGRTLYVNPFVPVGDLCIFPAHNETIENYRRRLDMDTGIVTVSYRVDGVDFRREYFSSWPAGVMAVRLSASREASLSGEVSLSRLLDPDCVVTGSAQPGEVVLEGRFEEGVRFAAVVKVHSRGGCLTEGRREYVPLPGDIPPKDENVITFAFRKEEVIPGNVGVSTCYESADEVLLLVAVATEDESADPVCWCREKLAAVPTNFEALRAEHVEDHQRFYRRVSLSLTNASKNPPAEELIPRCSAELYEKQFNLGRYLAITSGRPAPAGEPAGAPINLQGLWNQDRRPAWDCDYHLDLNLQMCYWPLPMVNLPELTAPVMDWLDSLLPRARQLAKDLFGARGILLSGSCDLRDLGTIDDLGFGWPGAAAWVAQFLWHHWEYTRDEAFLRDRLYPLLREIALFLKDMLIEDRQGRWVFLPGISPEMRIKTPKGISSQATMSSMDMELTREVFSRLLEASERFGIDADQRDGWREILHRVPLPTIDENGVLQEWLEPHEPDDIGHRHRSPFVGFSPGDRVTREETPEYAAATRKLLAVRQSTGGKTSSAFAMILDAQMHARFFEGDAALACLDFVAENWMMCNLLLSHIDWRPERKTLSWFPGQKIFQIEACIGVVAAVSEMLLQDRRGLITLLPALPGAWPDGTVTGLRTRGGFEVDVTWKNGSLQEARITSIRGETCRLRLMEKGFPITIHTEGRNSAVVQGEGILEFPTQAGETYIIHPRG